MYEKINMVIPDPDVDRLETLGDTFTSYAEALISAEGKISQVIASILEYNSGPAAHQFQLSETSVTSIHSHVQSLIPAGRNTARAYLESAAAAKYAVTTLDGLNQRYDESYNQAVRGGIGKEDEAFITLLVEEASKTMKAIESWATNKINSLFEDVVLPDPFLELMSRENIYKHVDQRIAEEFNEIARNDPERAKRILQKVADDFADSHGLERIPLSFDEADFSNDKVKNSGGYCQVDDNGRRIKIALNPKTLGSAVDKTPRDAGPVEN